MNIFIRLCVLGILVFFSTENHAIEVIPHQAIAPPPGLNAVMASYFNFQTGDLYADGNALGLGTRLDATLLLLRYTRTFSMADKPAAFYIQPSIGKLDPGGSLAPYDSVSGSGDLASAFAWWPYANRQTGTYFAVTGYLLAPTGSYDSNRLINIGQNRYSTALQLIYHFGLSDRFEMMLAADTQWFGRNDDYRLTHQVYEQKPLYSAQATLMYKLSKVHTLATSYFIHEGGESQLDNIDQNDENTIDRYQLVLVSDFDFGKVILQYGKDRKTENGFIENHHFILRYQRVWK